jgi:hypothetical protein
MTALKYRKFFHPGNSLEAKGWYFHVWLAGNEEQGLLVGPYPSRAERDRKLEETLRLNEARIV